MHSSKKKKKKQKLPAKQCKLNKPKTLLAFTISLEHWLFLYLDIIDIKQEIGDTTISTTKE